MDPKVHMEDLIAAKQDSPPVMADRRKSNGRGQGVMASPRQCSPPGPPAKLPCLRPGVDDSYEAHEAFNESKYATTAALDAFNRATTERCFICLAKDHRTANCRDPQYHPHPPPATAHPHLPTTLAPPQHTPPPPPSPRRPRHPPPVTSRPHPSPPPTTACPRPPPQKLPLPPPPPPPPSSPPPPWVQQRKVTRDPNTRPDKETIIMPNSFDPERDAKDWEGTTLVPWALHLPRGADAKDIEDLLLDKLHLQRGEVIVTMHKQEPFLVRFIDSAHYAATRNRGRFQGDGINICLQPWRNLSHALGLGIFFRVRLYLDSIPIHVCTPDIYINSDLVQPTDTRHIDLWAWTEPKQNSQGYAWRYGVSDSTPSDARAKFPARLLKPPWEQEPRERGHGEHDRSGKHEDDDWWGGKGSCDDRPFRLPHRNEDDDDDDNGYKHPGRGRWKAEFKGGQQRSVVPLAAYLPASTMPKPVPLKVSLATFAPALPHLDEHKSMVSAQVQALFNAQAMVLKNSLQAMVDSEDYHYDSTDGSGDRLSFSATEAAAMGPNMEDLLLLPLAAAATTPASVAPPPGATTLGTKAPTLDDAAKEALWPGDEDTAVPKEGHASPPNSEPAPAEGDSAPARSVHDLFANPEPPALQLQPTQRTRQRRTFNMNEVHRSARLVRKPAMPAIERKQRNLWRKLGVVDDEFTPIEHILQDFISMFQGALPDFIIGAMTTLFDLDDVVAEQMNDAILHMLGDAVDDLQQELNTTP
uniref:DUF4283 domain-containing protein n=1 Tax=Setaria viridis TaxID=4556 RepID=A0A4U6VWX5_SETVI|nr:hypothetical protein SEVIR_2G227900v2 [Setaria viridis]